MPLATFFEEYWQRKPLLVRSAMPGFVDPVSPDELAGLACEELAESRLVSGPDDSGHWQLETGPFAEDRFTQLGEANWTLLVQDVDKLLAEVDGLLESFRFIPDWRIDDIMVSFAAPGGSVGPHWDQYDVFLLQGQGSRRWLIDDRPDPQLEYQSGQDLKLLRNFDANQEWTLQAGDLLYLPPGVPHHGVALDEALTYSIGLRAPSEEEILIDYVETIAQPLREDQRYRDQRLETGMEPAKITAEAIQQLRDIMERQLLGSEAEFEHWAGSFLTRYRSAHVAVPPETPVTETELAAAIDGPASVYRNPWSRFAYLGSDSKVQLCVAGELFSTSKQAAQWLCAQKVLSGKPLTTFLRDPENHALMLQLCRLGHFVIGHD